MDKNDRRAICTAYKERKGLGGVYSITNRVTGEKHLFSTPNLQGAENRFEFMVQTNGCTVLSIQKEWASYGPDAFFFEVLESMEQGETQGARGWREGEKGGEELGREKPPPPAKGPQIEKGRWRPFSSGLMRFKW